MPYIEKSQRERYDQEIRILTCTLLCNGLRDGDLNYVISRLIDSVYERNYTSMNAALGVLEAAKQEYYRKVVGKYEDEKCREHGDVYD